jgi:hypothetical protein
LAEQIHQPFQRFSAVSSKPLETVPDFMGSTITGLKPGENEMKDF